MKFECGQLKKNNMETLLENLILNYQYITQASAEIFLPSPYPDDQIR